MEYYFEVESINCILLEVTCSAGPINRGRKRFYCSADIEDNESTSQFYSNAYRYILKAGHIFYLIITEFSHLNGNDQI